MKPWTVHSIESDKQSCTLNLGWVSGVSPWLIKSLKQLMIHWFPFPDKFLSNITRPKPIKQNMYPGWARFKASVQFKLICMMCDWTTSRSKRVCTRTKGRTAGRSENPSVRVSSDCLPKLSRNYRLLRNYIFEATDHTITLSNCLIASHLYTPGQSLLTVM